MEPIVYLRGYS